MKAIRSATLTAGLMVLGAGALPAGASSFTIAPIRVELGAAHRSATLTLTNADAQPVLIAVRAMAWSQPDGQEILTATHEVLANPPVLRIPGRGSQVVRVSLHRAPDAKREVTYRVVLDELPQAAASGLNALRVAMRISVPVFVAPRQGRAAPDVRWELHRLPDGEFDLVGINGGTAHLQVADLEVRLAASTPVPVRTAHYLLAGDRVAWRLKAGSPIPSDAVIVVQGHSDTGEFSAAVSDTDPDPPR
jgi:fimbrial chaperone protein